MDTEALVDQIKHVGFAYVDPIPLEQLREINLFFSRCMVYTDAHVPQTARNRGDERKFDYGNTECYCVHTDDAILAPHLFERALSFTDVAAAYLGVSLPVMYSANAFWTRPGVSPPRPDIQELHVDQDDTKFLALFVLLTETGIDEGPMDLVGPDGRMRQIFGPAGTCYLADTSRAHRGRKPRLMKRGVVWYRWGVSEYPPANRWDKIEPIAQACMGDRYPSDPRLQQSIRLLVS